MSSLTAQTRDASKTHQQTLREDAPTVGFAPCFRAPQAER